MPVPLAQAHGSMARQPLPIVGVGWGPGVV